jgi:hypothetical protein
MFRRLVLCFFLVAPLPAALAVPAPTPSTPAPIRLHLRVVDACPLAHETVAGACRAVHRRSDAAAPAPPQIQDLTPAAEESAASARAWQTLTF